MPWKSVLGSRQWQKCVDGGSWVSFALLTWLRNYKVSYFESFTEFGAMSEKCPELSRKWRISGKLFQAKGNAKSLQMVVPEFLWHCSLDAEIIKFLFCKFHWVWRDLRGMSRIIKKMTDIWKTVWGCRQWQKCVDGGSWVSLALLTGRRNYKVFYFRSFTEFDVMSEECPKLSRKRRISGKLF